MGKQDYKAIMRYNRMKTELLNYEQKNIKVLKEYMQAQKDIAETAKLCMEYATSHRNHDSVLDFIDALLNMDINGHADYENDLAFLGEFRYRAMLLSTN